MKRTTQLLMEYIELEKLLRKERIIENHEFIEDIETDGQELNIELRTENG